MNDFPFP